MHPESDAKDQQCVRLSLLYGCGGLLAVLIAWVHLLHPRLGLSRLLLYLDVGTLYDPRPPLFVASAILIGIGIGLWLVDLRRDVVYVGGLLLMASHLAGYVAWHTVLDHGVFWPHIEPHGHDHAGPLLTMVTHLATDELALVSKLAEAALFVVIAVILLIERR